MKRFAIQIVAACFFLLIAIHASQAAAGETITSPVDPDSASTWLLGAELNLSSGTPASEEEVPAIAYNAAHGEYMVVWHNNRPATKDIYARRISKNGQLLSWFTVSTATNCKYPSIAYSQISDEYLVVWSQYNASTSRWEIVGRIISWNAPGGNTPFLIASWSSMNLEQPVAVWNSFRNEYMVLWQTSLTTTSQLLGIGRRRLSNTGADLSNADMITGMGTTNQGTPDIAYNQAADGYLAVWVEPGTSAINVTGGRLDWQGTLLGSKFTIDPSSNDQQKPRLSTNEQDLYMVIWEEMVSGDLDVHGKEVNSVSGAVQPTLYLVAILLGADEHNADLACRGTDMECMFIWQQSSTTGESIQAIRWGKTFSPSVFEVAPGGFGDNEHPVLASGAPDYMVAYEWTSWTPGSDGDIFGRLWWPEATYLPMLTH